MLVNILILPDSFKGTLDSKTAGEVIENVARRAFPDSNIAHFPVSDGGEGFLDMVAAMTTCEEVPIRILDAKLEKTVDSKILIAGDCAYIESALACGYTQRAIGANATNASSYPLGQCIRAAIERGAKEIHIGLGGTITHDLGCGALAALGAEFRDQSGNAFIPNGSTLNQISSITKDNLITNVSFTIYSDVKNTLLGTYGAARVFAKQKGASDEEIEMLERNSCDAAAVFAKAFGKDCSTAISSGSAGGLGFAFISAFSATVKSGSEFALSSPVISKQLRQADLIITGEGKIDSQSKGGKLVGTLSEYAVAHNKKLLAIGGIIEKCSKDLLPEASWFLDLSSLHGKDYSMRNPHQAIEEGLGLLLSDIAGLSLHQ